MAINLASRFRADGSCSLCFGWLCKECQADNARRDDERAEVLRKSAQGAKQREIADICARYELESDEFLTREEKAENILASKRF